MEPADFEAMGFPANLVAWALSRSTNVEEVMELLLNRNLQPDSNDSNILGSYSQSDEDGSENQSHSGNNVQNLDPYHGGAVNLNDSNGPTNDTESVLALLNGLAGPPEQIDRNMTATEILAAA